MYEPEKEANLHKMDLLSLHICSDGTKKEFSF